MLSISSENDITHFAFPPDIQKAVKLSTAGNDRETAKFWVGTSTGSFGLIGTYDEIQDFCSDIAQSLMSWPILNNRDDWFTDGESEIIGKVADDARADAGPGAGDANGGGSQDRHRPTLNSQLDY